MPVIPGAIASPASPSIGVELPPTEQAADQTLKRIDRAIDDSDKNGPDGSLSEKELIYAVATGDLDHSKDKGFKEADRLMKEFVATMARPNRSAPSDLQST